MPKKKKAEKRAKTARKPATRLARQLKNKPLPVEKQVVNTRPHEVECMRCNAVTLIPYIGHNPTARFTCIQCNALLDIFNNCRTCNE